MQAAIRVPVADHHSVDVLQVRLYGGDLVSMFRNSFARNGLFISNSYWQRAKKIREIRKAISCEVSVSSYFEKPIPIDFSLAVLENINKSTQLQHKRRVCLLVDEARKDNPSMPTLHRYDYWFWKETQGCIHFIAAAYYSLNLDQRSKIKLNQRSNITIPVWWWACTWMSTDFASHFSTRVSILDFENILGNSS